MSSSSSSSSHRRRESSRERSHAHHRSEQKESQRTSNSQGSHQQRERARSRSRSRSRTRTEDRHARDRRDERRRRSRSRSRSKERRRRSRSRTRSRDRSRVDRSHHRSDLTTATATTASHSCSHAPHPSSSSSSTSSSSSPSLSRSVRRVYHPPPRDGIPLPSNPLPIHLYKDTLRQVLSSHPVVVVTGDTGSGKSTQLCQFLYEFGASEHGLIGVTQPRRIGAVSLAKRVSQELRPFVSSELSQLGQLVAYGVRFEDVSSANSQIKFLTDGCMLREVLTDPELEKYSTIVLDEAHERSLHTDVLFGIVKRIVNSGKRKYPLRVVITSATLDTSKFCAFFNHAPLVEVPGRCFPVKEIFEDSGKEEVDERNIVTRAVEKCVDIHTNNPPDSGHVLCFLTGQDDIDRAVKLMEKKVDDMFDDGLPVSDIVVLALYAALPAAEQQKVFAACPPDTRKVIFCTNICETSLTVDGVAFVVDCGLSKQKEWDTTTGIHTLAVATISQTSTKQRLGRAGRTRPGVCYRLYSEKVWSTFAADTLPEIQRTNLESTILLLKNFGISDVLHFEFIDRPASSQLRKALHDLAAIGALDLSGNLTPLGKRMSAFPLEPAQAKMILTAAEEGCLPEMLNVVSTLTAGDTLFSGKRGSEVDELRQSFQSTFGDHVSALFLFDSAAAEQFASGWMQEHGLNTRAIKQVRDVREQLMRITEQHKDTMEALAREGEKRRSDAGEEKPDVVTALRRSVARSFCHQLARLSPTGASYKPFPEQVSSWTSDTTQDSKRGPIDLGIFTTASATATAAASSLFIHPSSALASIKPLPKWVVYSEVLETGRLWMKTTCAVEYEWIKEQVARIKMIDVDKLGGGGAAANASSAATSIESTTAISIESEADIATRESRELQAKLLAPSKAQVDESSVSDAKARYLERKKLKEAGKK